MSVVPLHLRAFPPGLKEQAYTALTRLNVPYVTVDRAYRLWRANEKPARCRFRDEQMIAVDCVCDGCIEKLVMFYFDNVATKFAPMPGDLPLPLAAAGA